jgi:hypothetical protein
MKPFALALVLALSLASFARAEEDRSRDRRLLEGMRKINGERGPSEELAQEPRRPSRSAIAAGVLPGNAFASGGSSVQAKSATALALGAFFHRVFPSAEEDAGAGAALLGAIALVLLAVSHFALRSLGIRFVFVKRRQAKRSGPG